ncbi:MAG TPA: 6-phosphofructokinase [Planctomycetota bacterium]|nr:6-phosphofructokinase [Planctomycetota bacterium]
MADVLKGAAVFGQSGGPTTVINASMAGAILAAWKTPQITNLYGMHNGILGLLQEKLYDLRKEGKPAIEALSRCPASALGSCRYKVKTDADFARIVEILQAHNVRYFFYAGGNDSMDTADKVSKLAATKGYELRAMGVAKTIDNDLAFTDHTPGFGSVAKYNATMVMEAGRDTDAMYTADTCTVFETMGRNAGWIAAGAGMANRHPDDAPQLVYVPECPKTLDEIAEEVRAVHKRLGRVFVVASEGLKDHSGNYLSEDKGQFGKDAFGHAQLSGISDVLKNVIEAKVGIKARICRPGTLQRNGMHFASATDVKEAFTTGQLAVKWALQGDSGYMVAMERSKGKAYKVEFVKAKLTDVANGERKLPREYMNAEGNHISPAFRAYCAPLMQGQAKFDIGKDGLPVYVRMKRVLIQPKCGEWVKPAK